MSDKPKYNDEIPWDKMSPEDAAEIAKIKAKGGVRLNLATGVTALIISVVSIVIGQVGKTDTQTQITALVEQVGQLSQNNSTLTSELAQANMELTLLRREMELKDSRINELEILEKELMARIEELELKIKES